MRDGVSATGVCYGGDGGMGYAAVMLRERWSDGVSATGVCYGSNGGMGYAAVMLRERWNDGVYAARRMGWIFVCTH